MMPPLTTPQLTRPPLVTRLTRDSSRQAGTSAIPAPAQPDDTEPWLTADETVFDEPAPEVLAAPLDDRDLSDAQREADPTPVSSMHTPPPPPPASSGPPAVDGPAIRLFDPSAARDACAGDRDNPFEEDERGALLEKMATDTAAGYRTLAVPQAQQVAALRALETTTPHLAAVIAVVADAAEAALRRGAGFACPPVLIAGPPGVGKTRVIGRMVGILELPSIVLDGASMDDTAALAGHSRSWRASRPGTVAKDMIRGKVANAVLVIDEIDKAEADRRYGPTVWHVLHGLLEPETSRRWEDTCLEIAMDMSHIVVMATANELADIPPSLLDRFLVITVDAPGDSDLALLIQAVSAGVAARLNITDTPLAPGVLPLLAGLPPRRLRTILSLGWARAVAAGRDSPGEADIRHGIRLAGAARKHPIGFSIGRRPSSPAVRSIPSPLDSNAERKTL